MSTRVRASTKYFWVIGMYSSGVRHPPDDPVVGIASKLLDSFNRGGVFQCSVTMCSFSRASRTFSRNGEELLARKMKKMILISKSLSV